MFTNISVESTVCILRIEEYSNVRFEVFTAFFEYSGGCISEKSKIEVEFVLQIKGKLVPVLE
jgi:hypothetical protein